MPYGYTHESYGDSTQLLYLRSRYYASGTGRFLTRDTWGGNSKNPMSFNRWNYVDSNPVNRTDPSGRCWYPKSGGGVNYDLSDFSPNLCSWFINAFQSNGITIPANATQQNWLNSIPPSQQSIVAAYTTCIFQNNIFLGPSTIELWQIIRFYTQPKWHFYSSSNTQYVDVDLSLIGFGGEVEFSCDNNGPECTASYGYSVGQGVSIHGYHLGLEAGLELNVDQTGDIQLGASATAGPCDLFANFIRISIECQYLDFGATETIEVGWTRDALPQEYWLLAKASAFGSLSYDEYAKRNFPFRPGSKINHRVEYLGAREDIPWYYRNKIDYVLQ